MGTRTIGTAHKITGNEHSHVSSRTVLEPISTYNSILIYHCCPESDFVHRPNVHGVEYTSEISCPYRSRFEHLPSAHGNPRSFVYCLGGAPVSVSGSLRRSVFEHSYVG